MERRSFFRVVAGAISALATGALPKLLAAPAAPAIAPSPRWRDMPDCLTSCNFVHNVFTTGLDGRLTHRWSWVATGSIPEHLAQEVADWANSQMDVTRGFTRKVVAAKMVSDPPRNVWTELGLTFEDTEIETPKV